MLARRHEGIDFLEGIHQSLATAWPHLDHPRCATIKSALVKTNPDLIVCLSLVIWVTAVVRASATEPNLPEPGLQDVQISFQSLTPSATFKIGKAADWVLVTDDAVWVGGSEPYSVQRIDPVSDQIVAKIRLPGEACSGLAFGFGSIWVPVCGTAPSLIRVDVKTNTISAILPVSTAGEEGGIAVSGDSVWIVTDAKGTLARIDPRTNAVRQRVAVPAGSYNPIFSDGVIWITGVERNLLTAVDAFSGDVLKSVAVGPKPRFLTSGGGSIWTLNQGDGTVSRVDAGTKLVTATIPVGIPGEGGEICYGAGSVWTTKFGIPLSQIDPKTNKVIRQWTGRGGDAVRFGHESIWLTDYHAGLLWRIRFKEELQE